MYFTPFWCFTWGLGLKGAGAHTTCLCGLCSLNMEISETAFSHIVTIHNHQISYVKHVLYFAPLFFSLWVHEGAMYPLAVARP